MRVDYRALVVDGAHLVRFLTMRALRQEGFSCDAADNGVTAKRLCGTRRYDVVVMDPGIPGPSSDAMVSDLLAMPKRPAIVVLAGALDAGSAIDLLAHGVEGVDVKPVDYRSFAAKVRSLARHRRIREQEREQFADLRRAFNRASHC